ncbi:hypothetical protein Rhopal_003498-T1 [Rhodotorula paludigena]|uniref:L-type lectin-like domain-containing protein n=1 Tax=Rhodotorula paludigena TaxID=86838 RepID=A0AAV5GN85_9BASI|nr:hypothetical protein Rhopal_003498-T1 [Rhodotorula paludigena]
MLLLPAGVALAVAGAAGVSAQSAWQAPPNVHYEQEASWRGVSADGNVAGHDVAGHATVLPGVHDFLRLVPSVPLAHGAVFSRKPLKAKEWIAEIAFRVHGPAVSGMTETDHDGKVKRLHKGGRGLAFWYTKGGLPGPVTISSDPSAKVSPPPPSMPEGAHDPHDKDLSLFGSRTTFDGLGVIFDASPTAPVWRRSDDRNFHGGGHEHPASWGVGATGVVSGIIDDGTQTWLDPEHAKGPKGEEEAAYLDKAIGECEAAFRNAQGLLWARIAHYNHTIRVDLDLSPHTTLAKAGRHYEHNCFTLEGVNLPQNAYFGISGLASGNTEPDTIDVYAMDVFEIRSPDDAPVATDEPIEPLLEIPLEGTSDEAITSLTHEIFLSQARMVEAIDDLARKVESMQTAVNDVARRGTPQQYMPPPPSAFANNKPSGDNAALEGRIASLDEHLVNLMAIIQSRDHDNFDAHDNLVHLTQLTDKVLAEVQGVARKVDHGAQQHGAGVASLQARTAELVQLVQSAQDSLARAVGGAWSQWGWAGVAFVVGWIASRFRDNRRRDDAWEATRKLI